MRAEVLNPNDLTPIKQHSKTESTSFETPHFAYTLPLACIKSQTENIIERFNLFVRQQPTLKLK